MMIYGLGALFLKGISFFLIPLYTRMLSPEEYGNLELLNTFTGILDVVFAMGLFQYIYMDYWHHDKAGKRKLIYSVFSIYLAISTVFYLLTGFFLAFRHELILGDLKLSLIYLGVFTSYLGFFQNVFISLLKIEERAKFVTILQVLLGIIGMSLNIWLVYFLRAGISGIIWANAINLLISFSIATIIFREEIFRFTFLWDMNRVKSILRLSLPFVPGVISYWLMNSANRWILLHYGTLADVGIFSLAVKFTSIFDPIIIQPFLSSNNPRTMKRFSEGQYSQRLRLVFPAIISFFLVAGFAIKMAASWMIDKNFNASLVLIPVMVSGLSIGVLAQVTGLLLLYRKRVLYTFTSVFLGSMLSIISSFVLIPQLGPLGAALGTIVGGLTWLTLILIFYLKEKKNIRLTQ